MSISMTMKRAIKRLIPNDLLALYVRLRWPDKKATRYEIYQKDHRKYRDYDIERILDHSSCVHERDTPEKVLAQIVILYHTIEKGLTIGNLMAATRARTGRYGSYDDCRETMNLALSAEGIRFVEALGQEKLEEQDCIVPSRYMEHPKYTIGLGDTFMAGCLTAFVR